MKKETKEPKKISPYSEYITQMPDVPQERFVAPLPPADIAGAQPAEPAGTQPAHPAEEVKESELINSPYDVSYERTLLIDGEEEMDEPTAAPAPVINNAENDPEIMEVNTQSLAARELPFSIGVSSVIGKRKTQQDSVFVPEAQYTMQNGKAKFLCILSDGMGGLSSGDIASKTVVQCLSRAYYESIWKTGKKVARKFFVETAQMVNEEILDICDENGNYAKTGATLIAVEVDGDEMNLVNIGDSRIYFFREGASYQLTHDQNYLSKLMEMVSAGDITEQDALSHPKKEALISYCGIPELKLIETNLKPIALRENDIILLCSDGLYRLLNEQEMMAIIHSAGDDMPLAAYRLTQAANDKNYRGQDNTSVIVIKIIRTNNKEEIEL